MDRVTRLPLLLLAFASSMLSVAGGCDRRVACNAALQPTLLVYLTDAYGRQLLEYTDEWHAYTKPIWLESFEFRRGGRPIAEEFFWSWGGGANLFAYTPAEGRVEFLSSYADRELRADVDLGDYTGCTYDHVRNDDCLVFQLFEDRTEVHHRCDAVTGTIVVEPGEIGGTPPVEDAGVDVGDADAGIVDVPRDAHTGDAEADDVGDGSGSDLFRR